MAVSVARMWFGLRQRRRRRGCRGDVGNECSIVREHGGPRGWVAGVAWRRVWEMCRRERIGTGSVVEEVCALKTQARRGMAPSFSLWRPLLLDPAAGNCAPPLASPRCGRIGCRTSAPPAPAPSMCSPSTSANASIGATRTPPPRRPVEGEGQPTAPSPDAGGGGCGPSPPPPHATAAHAGTSHRRPRGLPPQLRPLGGRGRPPPHPARVDRERSRAPRPILGAPAPRRPPLQLQVVRRVATRTTLSIRCIPHSHEQRGRKANIDGSRRKRCVHTRPL